MQRARVHIRVPVVDCSKPDRTETIAASIRICRNADRMELIRAIILRWPDVTIDELWWGMRLERFGLAWNQMI